MKKSELLNLIEDAKTIGIFGHIRPDGDCVGSCLGLYNYIQDNYDAEVTVYLEKIPNKFSFLKGADAICHEPESRVLDLAISLDCGDRDRHGSFYELFGMAKKSACLDHHRSNQGFGDYYYCDADASSASEVLFRILIQRISRLPVQSVCISVSYMIPACSSIRHVQRIQCR